MIKIAKQSATAFQHTCAHPYAPAACIIAEVAGTCYAKDIDEAKAVEFCKKLISKGHESPFEFYQIGFDILTSRAVSHELVRHRIASYMQESQRYVSYRDCLTVIKPSNLPESCVPIWTEAMESGWANYCKLLDAGVKKEDARTVLPNSHKDDDEPTLLPKLLASKNASHSVERNEGARQSVCRSGSSRYYNPPTD
jgi:flavin-dependent thymidylate synthase